MLLLEPGEFYFEDYSVCLMNAHCILLEREISKCVGRLKVCSKSLVFDPQKTAIPIIKIPLKECIEIKKEENK